MNRVVIGILISGGLLVGMVFLLEVGRRLGRRLGKQEEAARPGLGAVEAAVFALLGLLIAFTFSGAASRFDARRGLIVEEANAIGTAWLRLDLLPPAAQPELRDLFRRYLDARLAGYGKMPDVKAAFAEFARANGLQGEIWKRAVPACQASPSPLTALVIPALNQMFDITTTRAMAAKTHPPAVVFVMLGILALVSALLSGYAMASGKTRSWIHILGYAVITAGTVYVILDLEYPRLGFIRIDAHDQVLVELRQGME